MDQTTMLQRLRGSVSYVP